MSCKSGLSTKQKYETQSEFTQPIPDSGSVESNSASMTWNGYMVKHFNDRMLKLERTLEMNSDRICAIETRHMTEDNCNAP